MKMFFITKYYDVKNGEKKKKETLGSDISHG